MFIDVAFPDDMSELAAISGHLTPRLAVNAVKRLPDEAVKVAVHLKPTFRDRILEQLHDSPDPLLSVGRIGRDYEF